MAYCTQTEIIEVIPKTVLAQLTDDKDGDTVDSSVISGHIAKSDSQINSYLRGKHSVPLSVVPEEVNRWSICLTVWNLYKRRTDLDLPTAIRDEYKQTIKDLESVRDGRTLIDDASSVQNTASFYKSSGANKGTLFTTNKDGTGSLDDYYNGPEGVSDFERST